MSHPVLHVAVTRADYASRLLDHLQDDAAVDVAPDVGVVWPHDPAGKERLVSTTVIPTRYQQLVL